ncbi:MAG TPA: ABC transporter permease [Vicinamibacterales bacterium]|nr:ABC transporter permease [Vicinamibacterales bacterium]
MRLYRALLHLYPRSFRLEYGREMTGVFAARRRARGPLGRLALWPGAVLEVAGNAAAVHADLLRQDVRQIARACSRAPGFVLTAVVIIGLGIGASTAAFSITEFVLFRPLPFPEPDRLVRLWETHPGYGQMELSAANARDWRRRQRSLDTFGLFSVQAANITGAGDPVRLDGATVDAELVDTLGVGPLAGRLITDADEVPSAPPVVVISYSLWQTRFGGAPDTLGRVIRLDDQAHEIVGVMPVTFAFPTPAADYWKPLQLDADDYLDRNNNYLHGLGRLRPGVSIDEARRDLQGVAAALAAEHPTTNRNAGANVFPLREGYSSRSRTLVLALFGAAACLLVITCVNLLNLMLARQLARRRELVVRTVLGAGRERLARQQLTETAIIAGAGGLVGIGIAAGAVPLFASLVPNTLPLSGGPTVDWRVWAYAAAATIGTGVLAGVLPALLRGRADTAALRDDTRAGGGARERVRGTLVAVSIVAAVVLLSGGGLLLRAMWKLQAIDPGFVAEDVLTIRTALPMPKYAVTDVRTRWYHDVLDQVRAVPGVADAAYVSFLPMAWRGGIWPVVMQGDELARQQGQVASLRYITPGFFEVMRIPRLAGRDVAVSDTLAQALGDARGVAVVSESFAERYWPGEAAIGRRFTFAFAEREIVGLVGDIRVRGLEVDSEPQVYLPAGQVWDGSLTFYAPKEMVIRAAGNRTGILPAVREILRRADPDLPIANVQWLTSIVDHETAPRAVQVRVLAIFAGVALLLAGVGIHGLLSFVVSERRQEIGVRMALGAQRGEVLALVLRRAITVTGTGLALGLAAAWWLGRLLDAALAGVPRTDPMTIVAVTLLIAVVTCIGSLVPAFRATRIDPARAMRAD